MTRRLHVPALPRETTGMELGGHRESSVSLPEQVVVASQQTGNHHQSVVEVA